MKKTCTQKRDTSVGYQLFDTKLVFTRACRPGHLSCGFVFASSPFMHEHAREEREGVGGQEDGGGGKKRTEMEETTEGGED